MFKAGGAITLALDSGTIHAVIGSEVSLNIYTPQIQARPISIGNGAEDVLVGWDSAGAMCIRANKGAVRLEQQLTGQTVLVPQTGDVSLTKRPDREFARSRRALRLRGANGDEADDSGNRTKSTCNQRRHQEKNRGSQNRRRRTRFLPAPSEEPVYQIFMPPLQYDAKAKVQADFDPNLINPGASSARAPHADFSGRVEGDPVVARAAARRRQRNHLQRRKLPGSLHLDPS